MTKAERVALAVKCCFYNGETDCSYGGNPCPYIRKPSCNRALGEDTIDVIERQQKEIERLKRMERR